MRSMYRPRGILEVRIVFKNELFNFGRAVCSFPGRRRPLVSLPLTPRELMARGLSGGALRNRQHLLESAEARKEAIPSPLQPNPPPSRVRKQLLQLHQQYVQAGGGSENRQQGEAKPLVEEQASASWAADLHQPLSSPPSLTEQHMRQTVSPPAIPLGKSKPKLLCPVVLVLNKIDLAADPTWVMTRAKELRRHCRVLHTVYLSALHRRGLDKLQSFLLKQAEPRPWKYNQHVVTTMPKTQQVEELIKSYLCCWFNKDLPYRVIQRTVGWTSQPDGSLLIEHELKVPGASGARVICGTRGQLVKRLGQHVGRLLSDAWEQPVRLLLAVKALDRADHKKQLKRPRIKT
eukprot:GHVT01076217.1.p1 GENE.GHVT01076217.1~~GHVT01076217.1.p1  ORF type:complete len:347 (-),score=55.63 GHVT01076217.1:327-1367(-)